jgi:DNA-binding protein YbaB
MNDPEAALRRLDELARSYPTRLAEAGTRAAETSRRQVSGASPDDEVTVTADGQGMITGVSFSATALRRLDGVAIGERATAALNAALDAAERHRADAVASTDLDQALEEVLDNLNYRLDGLVSQLADVERNLES